MLSFRPTQTAVAINTSLKAQSEKIGAIDTEMRELQGQLKRARRELVWFVRSARRDRCFICLSVMVAACAAFIIVWKIFGRRWQWQRAA